MATTTPGPIPKEAIAFFKRKKLRPAFSYLDVWKQEHATAFTVAKVMEVDVLETVRKAVQGAIADGETYAKFTDRVKGVLTSSGWGDYEEEAKARGQSTYDRLRIIYDTNLRSARAHAQWQRMDRTKAALPFVSYNLGPSTRHRPEHESWAGTIVRIDDPWLDSHTPSNGWLCKCFLMQLSRGRAERMGGETGAPPIERRPWKNPKTGQTEQVPVGIDPGFDFNPGKVPRPPTE